MITPTTDLHIPNELTMLKGLMSIACAPRGVLRKLDDEQLTYLYGEVQLASIKEFIEDGVA